MSRRPLAAALLMAGLLSGCGSASGPVAAVPTPTVSADPTSMVGMWTAQVGGDDVGVLRLGGEAAYFDGTCDVIGPWLATTDGGFLTRLGGDAACPQSQGAPTWLTSARGYRVVGADRRLVDNHGSVLATLVPGGTPVVPSGSSDSYYGSIPTPFPFQEKWRDQPAPLPRGLRAATEADVAGRRWHLVDHPKVFITFAQDGQWRGSNGCQPIGGSYSLGSAGEVLAVGLPQEAMSCSLGRELGVWLCARGRLAVSGEELVLFAHDGFEHEHLVATPLPSPS